MFCLRTMDEASQIEKEAPQLDSDSWECLQAGRVFLRWEKIKDPGKSRGDNVGVMERLCYWNALPANPLGVNENRSHPFLTPPLQQQHRQALGCDQDPFSRRMVDNLGSSDSPDGELQIKGGLLLLSPKLLPISALLRISPGLFEIVIRLTW